MEHSTIRKVQELSHSNTIASPYKIVVADEKRSLVLGLLLHLSPLLEFIAKQGIFYFCHGEEIHIHAYIFKISIKKKVHEARAVRNRACRSCFQDKKKIIV